MLYGKHRQGQAAIEYLILVSFAILVATPLLVQTQQSAGALQETTNQIEAANALDKMEDAATLVYSQGEPAKVTFSVQVPRGITQTNISDQYVHFRFEHRNGEADMFRFVPFNVTGTVPAERGRHTLVAEAVGRTNVSITPQ